jgi:hypothetical protein
MVSVGDDVMEVILHLQEVVFITGPIRCAICLQFIMIISLYMF